MFPRTIHTFSRTQARDDRCSTGLRKAVHVDQRLLLVGLHALMDQICGIPLPSNLKVTYSLHMSCHVHFNNLQSLPASLHQYGSSLNARSRLSYQILHFLVCQVSQWEREAELQHLRHGRAIAPVPSRGLNSRRQLQRRLLPAMFMECRDPAL